MLAVMNWNLAGANKFQVWSDPNYNYNLLEIIITDAKNKHMALKTVIFIKYMEGQRQ